MTRDSYLDAWAASHGGHDPRTGGRCERAWFTAVHALARPAAARGATPDALTVAAVAAALAAPVATALGVRWAPAVLVAGSAVLDGLDGAVATLSGRSSAWGHLADSLGDRLAEAAFGAALAVAGAPAALCVGAVALGWLQEYARARAAAGGLDEIVVVTVAERPTRVLAAALGLLGAAALPAVAGGCATVAAATWLLLGAAGAVQLLPALRSALEPARAT